MPASLRARPRRGSRPVCASLVKFWRALLRILAHLCGKLVCTSRGRRRRSTEDTRKEKGTGKARPPNEKEQSETAPRHESTSATRRDLEASPSACRPVRIRLARSDPTLIYHFVRRSLMHTLKKWLMPVSNIDIRCSPNRPVLVALHLPPPPSSPRSIHERPSSRLPMLLSKTRCVSPLSDTARLDAEIESAH
jgi:hypothetical protein